MWLYSKTIPTYESLMCVGETWLCTSKPLMQINFVVPMLIRIYVDYILGDKYEKNHSCFQNVFKSNIHSLGLKQILDQI